MRRAPQQRSQVLAYYKMQLRLQLMPCRLLHGIKPLLLLHAQLWLLLLLLLLLRLLLHLLCVLGLRSVPFGGQSSILLLLYFCVTL